ncbi:unnamed protein product [Malus baccata var. baccata]
MKGWMRFTTLGSFNQAHIVLNDTCIVEADVTIHGITDVLKLVLYPIGNKTRRGMWQAKSLLTGWEVYDVLGFSRYCIVMFISSSGVTTHVNEKEKCFHGIMPYSGFDQFVPLTAFTNASNRYLMEDIIGNGERLSMIKDAVKCKHVWKVENFSMLDAESYYSQLLIAEDQKSYLQ